MSDILGIVLLLFLWAALTDQIDVKIIVKPHEPLRSSEPLCETLDACEYELYECQDRLTKYREWKGEKR